MACLCSSYGNDWPRGSVTQRVVTRAPRERHASFTLGAFPGAYTHIPYAQTGDTSIRAARRDLQRSDRVQ